MNLLHRCDYSHTGAEAGQVTWLRITDDVHTDDAELRLCVHHSRRFAWLLMEAGFRPIPDLGVEL